MKILALQLKRIGDLVLTTPALRALKTAWPEAYVALGVMDSTASLLEAIPFIDGGIVFGRGFSPWQQTLTGGWDLCLDFTGNDRSAFATVLSRAPKRVALEWARRNRLRSVAYTTWSPSQVREVHTTQHYLDLVTQALPAESRSDTGLLPELTLPPDQKDAAGFDRPYAVLHPGTARPEKYWVAERWGEVAAHLRDRHGLATVLTCGPDAFEQQHVASIPFTEVPGAAKIARPDSLISLAATVARARIVISCDTAVVHFASAFRVPQVALFGPTNPFHWRPQHDRAVVLSAAQPSEPLRDFQPRMKGAPTDRISTTAVIHAIDSLLAPPR